MAEAPNQAGSNAASSATNQSKTDNKPEPTAEERAKLAEQGAKGKQVSEPYEPPVSDAVFGNAMPVQMAPEEVEAYTDTEKKK